MLANYQETQGKLMLCPSILSADFAKLGEAVALVQEHADVIHVDVMDGHYVPNLTLGPPIVGAIKPWSKKLPLDVHLMVAEPMQWLEAFAGAGADTLVIHAEACAHTLRALQQIEDLGCTPGIAINPGTSLSVIEECLPYVDMVLLMTVNPGFGGQSYIPSMTDKIRRLRVMLDQLDHPVHLQIDGGVNEDNIAELYAAGADMIVVGSSVYAKPDPVAALKTLRAACEE
ncbi:MAG: ribulose-phosphate 3-epimerase [Eubacteriales bacterium]|jgi:ribulose-phosphate 3-epimerase|nr:ribulose-phosphate 3-epimerase [Eubacteriales bacterium]